MKHTTHLLFPPSYLHLLCLGFSTRTPWLCTLHPTCRALSFPQAFHAGTSACSALHTLQPVKTFHCQVSPLLGNSAWPPPPVNPVTPHVFLVTPWVDRTPSTGDLATPWVDLVPPTGDSDHPLTCSPPTCASICPCTCPSGRVCLTAVSLGLSTGWTHPQALVAFQRSEGQRDKPQEPALL